MFWPTQYLAELNNKNGGGRQGWGGIRTSKVGLEADDISYLITLKKYFGNRVTSKKAIQGLPLGLSAATAGGTHVFSHWLGL